MSYKIGSRIVNVIKTSDSYTFTLVHNNLKYSGHIPFYKLKLSDFEDYMQYYADRKQVELSEDKDDNTFTLKLPEPFNSKNNNRVLLEQPEITRLKNQIELLREGVRKNDDNMQNKMHNLTLNTALGVGYVSSFGCIAHSFYQLNPSVFGAGLLLSGCTFTAHILYKY